MKPGRAPMVAMKFLARKIVAIVALLGALTWAHGGAISDQSLCQLCGMDAAKSETKFIIYLKTEPEMNACCVNCAHRLMKKLDTEVKQVTALDYRTRKYVPATEAFYVLGSKRIPQGSMMPFVFAFGSRKDADAFKDRYGGKVLTFAEIIYQLAAGQENK